MTYRDDLARVLSPQTTTGDVDWGRFKLTKRDLHDAARSLPAGVSGALTIIVPFRRIVRFVPRTDNQRCACGRDQSSGAIVMRLGKISVVAVLAVAATGLMATTGLAQSSSKSSTVSNREAPPFGPGLWETFYLDGRKYYRCNQTPGCSTLVSHSLEKIEGELDPAFEKEIEKQRAISTIPKRQLLSFDTKKRANDPRLVHSNWPNRAALTMSWRDGTEDATNVRFGSLRIVYERHTKILVLVTSSNLDAARKTEIAVSKSLSIFP